MCWHWAVEEYWEFFGADEFTIVSHGLLNEFVVGEQLGNIGMWLESLGGFAVGQLGTRHDQAKGMEVNEASGYVPSSLFQLE